MLALATLLGVILSGGVGVYFYSKLKGETAAEMAKLEAHMTQLTASVEVIQTSYVKREEVRQGIAKEGREIRDEVSKLTSTNKTVADYLASPVPDELQLALQRAHCLQVPSDCVHDGNKNPQ